MRVIAYWQRHMPQTYKVSKIKLAELNLFFDNKLRIIGVETGSLKNR